MGMRGDSSMYVVLLRAISCSSTIQGPPCREQPGYPGESGERPSFALPSLSTCRALLGNNLSAAPCQYIRAAVRLRRRRCLPAAGIARLLHSAPVLATRPHRIPARMLSRREPACHSAPVGRRIQLDNTSIITDGPHTPRDPGQVADASA